MNIDAFFEKIISVKLSEDRRFLDMIDQTLLPGEIKRIRLSKKEEIWEAIKKLRVRGAPAIGVSAAYAMAIFCAAIKTNQYGDFYRESKSLKEYLASSRPTAVNLF